MLVLTVPLDNPNWVQVHLLFVTTRILIYLKNKNKNYIMCFFQGITVKIDERAELVIARILSGSQIDKQGIVIV